MLILKVTGSVVLGYTRYFPPDFAADFLLGRESYFFDGYHWAFYWHIATSPLTLIFGMILLSDHFRMRFPNWHARLGKSPSRVDSAGRLSQRIMDGILCRIGLDHEFGICDACHQHSDLCRDRLENRRAKTLRHPSHLDAALFCAAVFCGGHPRNGRSIFRREPPSGLDLYSFRLGMLGRAVVGAGVDSAVESQSVNVT